MKAFPRMSHTDCYGYKHPAEDGMDLRDYFAAKAMSYWLCLPLSKDDLAKVSTEAYKVADAMMKAREQ